MPKMVFRKYWPVILKKELKIQEGAFGKNFNLEIYKSGNVGLF